MFADYMEQNYVGKKYNGINIDDIHNAIVHLYKRYKYPWLTALLPMDQLHAWGKKHSRRLGIDEDVFTQCATSIFWAISHVQSELGYALIARQSISNPKGLKGSAYKIDELPIINISDLYFWQHMYLTTECIYRCWGRLTRILQVACYPKSVNKYYFDGLMERISGDAHFQKNAALKELMKQIKHWNNIAEDRNYLSHVESSPMKEFEINAEITSIYAPTGQSIYRFHYSHKDIRQEIDKQKNRYLKLKPAIKAVVSFIENLK
jgi:hypothetical protein